MKISNDLDVVYYFPFSINYDNSNFEWAYGSRAVDKEGDVVYHLFTVLDSTERHVPTIFRYDEAADTQLFMSYDQYNDFTSIQSTTYSSIMVGATHLFAASLTLSGLGSRKEQKNYHYYFYKIDKTTLVPVDLKIMFDDDDAAIDRS